MCFGALSSLVRVGNPPTRASIRYKFRDGRCCPTKDERTKQFLDTEVPSATVVARTPDEKKWSTKGHVGRHVIIHLRTRDMHVAVAGVECAIVPDFVEIFTCHEPLRFLVLPKHAVPVLRWMLTIYEV